MKTRSVSFLPDHRALSALACTVILLVSGLSFAASAPPQFTYKGQLMEIVNGISTPVTSGADDIFSVDMWVRLYNSTSAAKPDGALYGRKVSVVVNKGIFAIDIGDEYGEPLPGVYTNLLDLISGSSSTTLLVGITPFADTNDEITPRQQLFSAPFALLANDVSQALGNFTATNGISLFQALDVAEKTVFKGPVANLGTVNINGNASFANGMTSLGMTTAKQLFVDGTLIQNTGTTTINGPLTVTRDATFQSGPLTINGGATLQGNISVNSLTVEDALTAGALTVTSPDLITTSTLTCPTTLTVNGKAVFGTYFPNSAWANRVAADISSGYFTAPTDGLYVFSVMIRREDKGYGSLTFTVGTGGPTFTPYMTASTSRYTVNGTTISVLLKAGEQVYLSNEVSHGCSASQVEYQAFNGL